MFCPKCGQQSPEEVRFCPRCGLSLAGLPGYVAANDFAAARHEAAPPPEMTPRRRNMRRGAKLMFFSAVLFPLFLIISFANEAGEPLLVPFLLFLAGLTWLIYARLFMDNFLAARGPASSRDLNAGVDRRALGTPRFAPVSAFDQQRANTAEIVQPPSVTEHTTRLLDKDA